MSDLGLSEDVLPVLPSHKGAKRRMIYTSKNGLVDVPSGVSWLFQTKPPFSRPLLWAVLREISLKRSGMEDESVYDFFARRLNQEVQLGKLAPGTLLMSVLASFPGSSLRSECAGRSLGTRLWMHYGDTILLLLTIALILLDLSASVLDEQVCIPHSCLCKH